MQFASSSYFQRVAYQESLIKVIMPGTYERLMSGCVVKEAGQILNAGSVLWFRCVDVLKRKMKEGCYALD